MPQYELNLRDYWQIIQRRRLVLAVIFFAVLVSSIIYTNTQRPVYQAVALVQWIERRTFASLFIELTYVRGDPLVTQSRIITTLPVLEKAVKELGLVDEHASAAEIMEQAAAIQGAVSTNIVSGTNIIRIIVTHGNPQMAANIANKIAEVYIIENQKERSKESRNVREFIEKQLEEISVKLKNSEEALARFKETEVPSGVGLSLQNRLTDLETERNKLLQKYTEIYPDVKNIEDEIILVEEQLKALPQKELEYSRLSRDVEINAKLYRDLKDKLEAARIAEAEKIEDASLVDRAVPPGVPIGPNKPNNYFLGAVMGLMLGLAGTFVVEHLDTSIGTIEDVESFLKLPTLGVIPYLRTKEEKTTTFIRRFLPKEFKGEKKILRMRNQLLVYYSSFSPVFEAYRILRTNIQTEVFKEKIKGKILLFSSPGPQEGKSINVANLAIVMAQAGLRILLVDGDMRRSVIHKIFGLKKEPGLCDILRGTSKTEEAIRKFTDISLSELGFDEALKVQGLDNLYILTSGSSPTIPVELLGSPEAAVALLEELRGRFDIILIDSPPVLVVADVAILAPKTDGVILVYLVGKTARSVLLRAKKQLMESGIQVKGIILNNISPQIEMRYGYYYHYKYYGKHYGEEKGKT